MAQVVFFAHKGPRPTGLNGAIVNAHLEFTQEAIQVLRQGVPARTKCTAATAEASATAGGVSLAAG
jgi:flagella synthesis protein FlgN